MQEEQSEICLHHEALLLTKYEFLQKECCNPFQDHGSGRKAGLQRIDLATADSLTAPTSKTFHPGQKLCLKCRVALAEMHERTSSASSESDSEIKKEREQALLNESITPLGVSPLKLTAVSRQDSHGYAKRKISQLQDVVHQRVASAGGLDPASLQASSSHQKQEGCICQDYSELLKELKEKMAVSNHQQKLQILTLRPKSWSTERTMSDWSTSSNHQLHILVHSTHTHTGYTPFWPELTEL